MSGGHFNYAYRRVEDFCESLSGELWKIKNKESGEEYGFSEKTIKILYRDLENCVELTKRMRDIEWVFSGDSSESILLEDEFFDKCKKKVPIVTDETGEK